MPFYSGTPMSELTMGERRRIFSMYVVHRRR